MSLFTEIWDRGWGGVRGKGGSGVVGGGWENWGAPVGMGGSLWVLGGSLWIWGFWSLQGGSRGSGGPYSLRKKCILSAMSFLSGSRRLSSWARALTVASLLSPVRLVWNFLSRSLVVIGFRDRYRRTASSVSCTSLREPGGGQRGWGPTAPGPPGSPLTPQTHPLLGVDFPEWGWGVHLPEGGPGSAFSRFWGGGSDPPGGARRPGGR